MFEKATRALMTFDFRLFAADALADFVANDGRLRSFLFCSVVYDLLFNEKHFGKLEAGRRKK